MCIRVAPIGAPGTAPRRPQAAAPESWAWVSDPDTRHEDTPTRCSPLSPPPGSWPGTTKRCGPRRGPRESARRLAREPVFGPLVGSVARRGAAARIPRADARTLGEIERRSAESTPPLGALLRLGPRTKLDASALAGWIRDVEAEMPPGRIAWTRASILMRAWKWSSRSSGARSPPSREPAAKRAGRGGRRRGDRRLGRGARRSRPEPQIVLLVGDSSGHAVSLEAIEQRESGRGAGAGARPDARMAGTCIVRRPRSRRGPGSGLLPGAGA